MYRLFLRVHTWTTATFPNSAEVVEKLAAAAELSEHETWQFVRGNAIECYGLSRYGITD
jgi:hypothetical protein